MKAETKNKAHNIKGRKEFKLIIIINIMKLQRQSDLRNTIKLSDFVLNVRISFA